MIQNFLGFSTLIKREVMRYMRVAGQTIISPLLSNMLFLGVFGGVFAGREVGIDGVDYLSFLVPGLCIMGAINASYQNPSSSLMIQKYQNIIQDLNTFPISSFEKTLAYLIAGTSRGMIVAGLTYVSTIPFIGYSVEHPLLFIGALAGVSVIFTAIGILVGLLGETFDVVAFWQSIVLNPLVYFGGVFFEVTQLPGILSTLAQYNPLFPLVDAVRYGYLGVSEGNLHIDLIVMGVILVATIGAAHWCMVQGKGLRD